MATAKKKPAPRKKVDKSILATITDEERAEYAQRNNVFIISRTHYLACAAYVDQYSDFLRLKYELPETFKLDLETGQARVDKEASNGDVPSN